MGRWDDYDDNWNYYRPDQPIRIEGGLKARSKQGAIGSTWWSRRWISVLESFSMGNRLTRGRIYARQGQVVSIDVDPGEVMARVQGSQPRPYTVSIQLKPLADEQWERVSDAMAAQALFAAKLLAGEMPRNIEEAFSAAHLALFPTAEQDLVTSCTCPDWANPCKHTAAVYYLLAERFDEDPFLIFKLRGRSKSEIIEAL
ncbi:MAG TPA: SWIM zinc finger family protein, partial [Ktedonobacteraceae bacterium]|nr:SWIM zinc finger family protein [Ktedonobacteraceae bacterium]